MKTHIRCTLFGRLGTATWLVLPPANLCAQDGPPQGAGNPSQMRQRMLDRMKERFGVQDDAEWKLISDSSSPIGG